MYFDAMINVKDSIRGALARSMSGRACLLAGGRLNLVPFAKLERRFPDGGFMRPVRSVVVHLIVALGLILGVGAPAFGAIPALVQKASRISSSATALPLATVSPVTAGNLIVVSVSSWPNAPTSVTDTLGSAFILAGAIRATGGGSYTAIYYARVVAGGADTVTFRTGGSAGQMSMVIAEFTNIDPVAPIDAAAGAVGASNLPSSGNLTPSVTGDLMIIAGTHDDTLVTTAYAGSTMIAVATENCTTNQPLAMAYQILNTTSPTPARFNLSASAPWAQNGALFKASSSGEPTPPVVTITSPSNGATVAGSLSVVGTASSNVGLSKVEVRVDAGVWNTAAGLGNWSYVIDTLNLANGPHTITASATDVGGNASQVARSVTVDNTVSPPPTGDLPVEVGSRIAGSFADATGHSNQRHLVYAVNSGVWWLFTLTSTADSRNNFIIKSYFSSGPDLRTASWTPAPGSPAASATNSSNAFMGGGRALSVAYLNNGGVDVIHAEIAMAYDGQDGTVAHIRGRLSAGAMTWENWNYHVEGAATWTLPRNTAIGVSSGKFIHTGGAILQQQVDANARRSNNADAGTTWTPGFSAVAVIDNSMIHASNALAFASLEDNVMLAVYDNGGGASCGYNCIPPGSPSEPNLSNLGYKRSNADGSWTGVPPGTQGPGDGQVFAADAIVNQNDWTLVGLNTASVYGFRRSASGAGVDSAFYNVAGNNWSALAPQPPLFASGQAFKSGAGLFGATDGENIWLFVINTDTANSVLYTQFDGSGGYWTPWAAVPGTDVGAHARSYISGHPEPLNHQIAVLWTEGPSPYGEVVTVFDTGLGGPPDTTQPTVTIVTPSAGATVSGTVTVSGVAADDAGLSLVEVQVDAGAYSPAAGLSSWTYALNTLTLSNGSHTIRARATDTSGNMQVTAIAVTVSNIVNLVNNPGFESGNSLWSFPARGSIDSTSPHTGVNAAKIARNSTGTSTILNNPRVSVQGGASYSAEVWVESSGVTGGSGVRVLLRWFNSAGTAVGNRVLLTGLFGTSDWMKVSGSALVAPVTAVTARLELQLYNAKGTVWFDDVLFYSTGR